MKEIQFPVHRTLNDRQPEKEPTKSFKTVVQQKTKDKNKKEEKSSPFSGVFSLPSQIEKSASASTTSLSPSLDHLMEHLEDHMLTLIETSDGDTHLTTTYQREGSIFDGCEIHLDHFSTAPHSFRIHLYGSPQAAQLLDANLSVLIARLEKNLPDMQFHILPPFLKNEAKAHEPNRKADKKNMRASAIKRRLM